MFKRQRFALAREAYYDHIVSTSTLDIGKFSIVVPCFNTPARYLEPLISSIFAQSYQNWELVLVDASTTEEFEELIRNRAATDKRIVYKKISNRGIAANTNEAIKLASGDFISFMDHDDTLDPNALSETAKLFATNPTLSVVYTDEDKITDDGSEYFDPHFKPGFSLDLLRNVNYVNHFTTARMTLIESLGGIREGFDGAQDYDFLLRAVDTGAQFGHIPKILYHWRQAENSTAADFSNKQYVTKAGCKALEEHYARNQIKNVQVSAIKNRPGFYKADYQLSPRHKRAIFINFDDYSLTPVEKDYIVSRYESNQHVTENSIKVLTTKPKKGVYQTVCVVNGPFFPSGNEVDIANMFALAEQPGVQAVSPRIVRHGKIFDMGILKTKTSNHWLFKGVDPSKPQQFGSIEWVRNVDELSDRVKITSQDHESAGRNVIWSHSEFVAFINQQWDQEYDPLAFYNPNLETNTEYQELINDYLTDLIEVRK